jgi:hypothetical protein
VTRLVTRMLLRGKRAAGCRRAWEDLQGWGSPVAAPRHAWRSWGRPGQTTLSVSSFAITSAS